jgi:hypothetical protein
MHYSEYEQRKLDQETEAQMARRPSHGPAMRHDGLWIAYRNGLPLMTAAFENILYATRALAEQALKQTAS